MAGVLAMASVAPAAADVGGQVDCTQTPDSPKCVVVVVDAGGGDDGDGGSVHCTQAGTVVPCFDPTWGWLGSDGCRYKLDPHPPAFVKPPAGADPESGAVYMRTCSKMGNLDESVDPVWLDFRDVPFLRALLQKAMDELHLPQPVIRTNPATSAPQVVFVPTWLWVDAAVWHDYTATAAVPGLSLSVTAAPVSVTWQTGDGASVTCGPGTVWEPGTDPAAASADCGHTYTTSSRQTGTFTLTASITWRVTWAGGGASGTEPAMTSTSSVQVRVVESSVLNTK